MTAVPVYDVESMQLTVSKVDQLADDFRASKGKITGPEGESPFGEVEDPDDPERADGAMTGFTTGMQNEFEAAAGLMSAASTALRDAIAAMAETDAASADHLKLEGEL